MTGPKPATFQMCFACFAAVLWLRGSSDTYVLPYTLPCDGSVKKHTFMSEPQAMSVVSTALGAQAGHNAGAQNPPHSQEQQSHQRNETDASPAAVNELLLKLLVTTT